MFVKQLIATVFLLAFALQTFNKSFVVYDYYANTTSYAKNCINKAKPQLHCNGKCQMMKKLQEQEKKDQQNQERKGNYKQLITLSSKSFFAVLSHNSIIPHKILYPQFNDDKECKIPKKVFHPPGLV